MSEMLVDRTKAALPTLPKIPGSNHDLAVTNATPVVFTPTPALTRNTIYEIRTTADIRFATHPTAYAFSLAQEAWLWAGEIDWIELGPASSCPRQLLTMQATAGNALVSIVMCA